MKFLQNRFLELYRLVDKDDVANAEIVCEEICEYLKISPPIPDITFVNQIIPEFPPIIVNPNSYLEMTSYRSTAMLELIQKYFSI